MKDSDHREMKSSEAEKDSDQREWKNWVAHGLGLRGLGSCCLGVRGLGCAQPGLTLPRLARSGLRAAWVCHPLWSRSLFLFLVFFFFSAFFSDVLVFLFLVFFFFFPLLSSLMFWCSSDLFLFVRVRNRVSKTRFPCSHVEKYATSELIRA